MLGDFSNGSCIQGNWDWFLWHLDCNNTMDLWNVPDKWHLSENKAVLGAL